MEIEALAALRLNQSPRRYRGSKHFNYEDESAPSSPYYLSAPTSPHRASLREVEETPLGEVLAAVPFDWEERPGTPKRGRGSRENADILRDSSGEEERASRSRSPSPERFSPQSSTCEFDFSSARFLTEEDTHALNNEVPIASADQLFFHGQLLPLRLPPRLQAVKQLRESSASPFSDGIHSSFRKPVSPRLGNSPTMKQLLSFRGRSKSPQRGARDAAIWPLQEAGESGRKTGTGAKLQKFRSLSPLKLFKRENSEVSIIFSEKSASSSDFASSSASSAFSSSSGDENYDVGVSRTFWPSFEEKNRNGKTVNDFLYSDKSPTSPKIDISKLSSKEVLSKAEKFKASKEGLKSLQLSELEATKHEKTGSERKKLTPQLSRSNARSISRYGSFPSTISVYPLFSLEVWSSTASILDTS